MVSFTKIILSNLREYIISDSIEHRNLMRGIQRDPRVVLLSNQMGIVETLTNMLDQLNRSQKALNQYLEVKRSLFPRFYFLGDEDLLEILGQATRPQIIQSHLKKLFSGEWVERHLSNPATLSAQMFESIENPAIVRIILPTRIVAQCNYSPE